MGRRLTPWERAQREREREAERKRRAKKVARRREAERLIRETKLKNDIKSAEKAVKQYNSFYNSIINLHLANIGKMTFAKKFKHELSYKDKRGFSSKLEKPEEPSMFKFVPKKKLSKLKLQSSYNFESFCTAEGKSTFFLLVFLLGTKNEYKNFIDKTNNQYLELKEKEDHRKVKEKKQFDKKLSIYNDELTKYETELSLEKSNYEKKIERKKQKFEIEENKRKFWFDRVIAGDNNSQEEACELMFPIEYRLDEEFVMSNPTDSEVGYRIINSDTVLLCINLPSNLIFLPEKGLKMTPSGKNASEFKVTEKMNIEVADKVICSIAFSYVKSIFNILPKIQNINIEVGIAGIDPKTGGAEDIIFLIMKLDRDGYKKIKISKIDVGRAIENFDYKFRSTKTKKNYEGEINRDELIWATDDDGNINISKHIQQTFRNCFYS